TDIHALAAESRRLRSEDICLNHVVNEREVARLFTCTEYDGPLSAHVCRDEFGDGGSVLRRRILSWSEHIEIPQAHRLHAVELRGKMEDHVDPAEQRFQRRGEQVGLDESGLTYFRDVRLVSCS